MSENPPDHPADDAGAVAVMAAHQLYIWKKVYCKGISRPCGPSKGVNPMTPKRTLRLWAVSLIICAVSSMIINLNSMFAFGLPLWALLVCGGLSLLGLPVLIWTTVLRLKQAKAEAAAKGGDAP